MTGWRFAVAVAVEVALVVVIAGVVVRSRWRLSRFFAAYLLAVLTGNVLITWWPQRFFDFDFWMAKEIVYSFLKIGIVAEVAWLTCRPFPGSAILTRRRLLLLLVVTTVAVLVSPPPWEEARRAWGGSHARPRAHIRRAHWHTYLTGPRAADQRRELRWLPPIPVNVDLGQIVPTIRRVE